MQTYDHEGLAIAYERAGQGEPVILLHNGGTSHAIWRDVVPELARTHEVFALDLAPVAIAGNCMGSAIALSYAAVKPAAVSALVLINPLTEATFRAGGLGTLMQVRRSLPTFSQPVIAGLRALRVPQMFRRRFVRMQLGRIGREAGLDRDPDLCGCFDSRGQLRALLGVFDDLRSYRALDELSPEALPPITMVWGLDNHVLSPDAGKRLAETLRPVHQDWLAGCGHLPMLEAPARVAGIIARALAERRSGSDDDRSRREDHAMTPGLAPTSATLVRSMR